MLILVLKMKKMMLNSIKKFSLNKNKNNLFNINNINKMIDISFYLIKGSF